MKHTITKTLPDGTELELSWLGAVGLLTYWLDAIDHEVYTYNLDNAQLVNRGAMSSLQQLPQHLRPK